MLTKPNELVPYKFLSMTHPLIIMPVGTSLLNNTGGETQQRKRRLQGFLRVQQVARDYLDRDYVTPLAKAIWEHLIANGRLDEELGLREQATRRNASRDALPQELSYLALLAQQRGSLGADVALLASDSKEGLFCADTIHEFLRMHHSELPWSCYCASDPITIEGLRTDKRCKNDNPSEDFEKRGIPNLVQEIQKRVSHSNPSEVILNISGGFKGAIPYTTLALHLLQETEVPIRIHYLFEDTDQIIELPIYPLGLDYPRWHRNRNLLEAAKKHPHLYQAHLDQRMRAVLEQQAQLTASYSVPNLLEKQYDTQRGKDPLQIYSTRVIKRFIPNKDYQGRLLDLVEKYGPLIWYGDRVPMAAEHASRHHHHLLEIAELILTPIAGANCKGEVPFLNDEERFVLFAALLLHDCGHTVGALPLKNNGGLVPLFISEVRDLHHFLSWHRLRQKDVNETLGWDPTAPLAEEVAWLCLYHRARMGWNSIEDKRGRKRCPFLDKEVPPPLELVEWMRNECQATEFALNIDFPKLVALLRMIDGLDIQSHRAGGSPTMKVVLAHFKSDKETARESIAALLPLAERALDQVSNGGPWEKAKKLCKKVGEWLNRRDESQRPKQDAAFWKTRDEMVDVMAQSSSTREELAAAAAWTQLARAFDEYCTRDRQFPHFVKHNAVSRLTILPAENFDLNSRWLFDVTLELSGEYKDKLEDREFARQWEGEIGEAATFKEWILNEIKAEAEGGPEHYLKGVSRKEFRLMPKWKEG